MQDNNNNNEEKTDPNQGPNQINNILLQTLSFLPLFGININSNAIRANLQMASAAGFCQQVTAACDRLMDHSRRQSAFNTEDWKSVITIFYYTKKNGTKLTNSSGALWNSTIYVERTGSSICVKHNSGSCSSVCN